MELLILFDYVYFDYNNLFINSTDTLKKTFYKSITFIEDKKYQLQ